VTLRDGQLVDITTKERPTLSALLEQPDPAVVRPRGQGTASRHAGDEVAANSTGKPDAALPYLLAPADLQAIKACGVTFAQSMIERVIEEKAAGNPSAPQRSANASAR
jgi:fumarylacetoacetate (FAA) hydrolase family protein